MTAIDTDFGFDAVFRKSAAELKVRLTRDVELGIKPQSVRRRGTLAAFSVFAGLGALSVGIFIIGCSALRSDSPEIWIHRLMALAIVQSILIAAVSMKILPVLERGRSLTKVSATPRRAPALEPPRMSPMPMPTPPPLPSPPKAVVGGQLAGREFLEYGDGSIEIDTLVGRRRFASLDAAREFVGA
ncbi:MULTISPECIES: hypothetical protein [unclassified Hyphomicrobium]|uniref:hypothetical protein n=1 Tax=unclassified Hyphomicrobium TaxID=2619925 RepID=UPI000213D8C5|nr:MULTISPECIES: hypothetical protein [unclassified Hyphomicrobium]CCB67512.1 conserved protein of unknown function [Hyphomicrobium sp. MC1]